MDGTAGRAADAYSRRNILRGMGRPSYLGAAAPETAKALYEEFCAALRRLSIDVGTGVFQAMMSVELVNEGPVTILLDSDKTF